MPSKVALTHMSRDTNRGDFAILAATHRVLLEHEPGATITAVSVELGNVGLDDPRNTGLTRRLGCSIVGTPAPPRNCYSGPTWRWLARLLRCEVVLNLSSLVGPSAFKLMPRDTRAFVQAISEADVVVAKGGSYIHALGGVRELLYLWRMLYPIRVAKRFGTTVTLLGVSVGEFRSRGSRRLARLTLRRGVVLYVRERRSMEVARRELRLAPQDVRLIPDLAFLSEPDIRDQTDTASTPRIGVTVRAHHYPRDDVEAARRNYVQVLGDTFRGLLDLEPRLSIVFIPQVSEDTTLAREIAEHIARPPRVEVLTDDLDVAGLLRLYGSLELLVGARLHSVILAAVAGVPAVHVIYEPAKSYGTLDLLGITDFGIRYEDVNTDDLTALIGRARESRTALQERILARVSELRDDIRRAVAAEWEGHRHHESPP